MASSLHSSANPQNERYILPVCKARNFDAVLMPHVKSKYRFNGTICEEYFAQLGSAVLKMRKTYGEVYYFMVHEENNVDIIASNKSREI